MHELNSLLAFRNAGLVVSVDDFVPAKLRRRLRALPSEVTVRGWEVEIGYEVEDWAMPIAPGEEDTVPSGAAAAEATTAEEVMRVGVARLRLPEKLARTLDKDELPALDRPLRFEVSRGSRGVLRADTIGELQELLEGPWTPTEKFEDESGRNRHSRRKEARSQQSPRNAPKRGARGGPPRNSRGGRRGRPRR